MFAPSESAICPPTYSPTRATMFTSSVSNHQPDHSPTQSSSHQLCRQAGHLPDHQPCHRPNHSSSRPLATDLATNPAGQRAQNAHPHKGSTPRVSCDALFRQVLQLLRLPKTENGPLEGRPFLYCLMRIAFIRRNELSKINFPASKSDTAAQPTRFHRKSRDTLRIERILPQGERPRQPRHPQSPIP